LRASTPSRHRPFPPELSKPPSTRTSFAVQLQLGRSYASLIALVRAVGDDTPSAIRVHARQIASVILGGARDRSRDAHQRPLRDQQARTEPLRAKREPRKKYVRKGVKTEKPPAFGVKRRCSKVLCKKPRRARNASRQGAIGTR
jgi:hypothetical protein